MDASVSGYHSYNKHCYRYESVCIRNGEISLGNRKSEEPLGTLLILDYDSHVPPYTFRIPAIKMLDYHYLLLSTLLVHFITFWVF